MDFNYIDEKRWNLIYSYWLSPSRVQLGEKLINSSLITEQDLLFLIPNNYKKMHGFPMAKSYGKNRISKKRKKYRRMRYILNNIFPLIEELVIEELEKELEKDFASDRWMTISEMPKGDFYYECKN